MSLLEPKTS